MDTLAWNWNGLEMTHSLSFPIGGSIKKAKGDSGLMTSQSMVNLILRYPGNVFRPYAGIGGGLSSGILINADIPGRKDRKFETGTALGYQFFGGMHVVISERWFVFGEYQYFSANYHWKQLFLRYRSEDVLGGIGFLF